METPPPLPRVNLSKVELLFERLARELVPYVGHQLTPDVRHKCARVLTSAHTAQGIRRQAVADSLALYPEEEITLANIDSWARQFAGRTRELKDGVITAFDRPSAPIWVPVEIQAVRASRWRNDNPASILSLYGLYGPPSGVTLEKKVPERWLAWLAYKIGFSRRLAYDYNPEQFIGLRFWALVGYDTEKEDLEFADWAITAALRKRNQEMAYKRVRFDLDAHRVKYTCPFDLGCYCFDCDKSVLDCNASVRRELGYVTAVYRATIDRQSGGSPGGNGDPSEAHGGTSAAGDT